MSNHFIAESEITQFIKSFKPPQPFVINQSQIKEICKVYCNLMVLLNKYGVNNDTKELLRLVSTKLQNQLNNPFHRSMTLLLMVLVEAIELKQLQLEQVRQIVMLPLNNILKQLVQFGHYNVFKENYNIVRNCLELIIDKRLKTESSHLIYDRLTTDWLKNSQGDQAKPSSNAALKADAAEPHSLDLNLLLTKNKNQVHQQIIKEAKGNIPEIKKSIQILQKNIGEISMVDLIAHRLNNIKNLADLAKIDSLFNVLEKSEKFVLSYLQKKEVDDHFFQSMVIQLKQIDNEIAMLLRKQKNTASHFEPNNQLANDESQQVNNYKATAQPQIEHSKSDNKDVVNSPKIRNAELHAKVNQLMSKQAETSNCLHNLSNHLTNLNHVKQRYNLFVKNFEKQGKSNVNFNEQLQLLKATQDEFSQLMYAIFENKSTLQLVLQQDSEVIREIETMLTNKVAITSNLSPKLMSNQKLVTESRQTQSQ